MTVEDQDAIAQERLVKAIPVVQAYGQLLGSVDPEAEFEVLDAGELPHPKMAIRDALMTVLQSSTDPAEKRTLAFAYSVLARFQDVVTDSQDEAAQAANVESVKAERSVLLGELQVAGFEL